MTVTALVAVNLPDASDLPTEASQMQDDLEARGWDIASIHFWAVPVDPASQPAGGFIPIDPSLQQFGTPPNV